MDLSRACKVSNHNRWTPSGRTGSSRWDTRQYDTVLAKRRPQQYMQRPKVQARPKVLVSPFVSRLNDIGENGMDLIANINKMYKTGDRHVVVLTASVRKLDHLLYTFRLGSDIITVPLSVLKEWAPKELSIPGEHYRYNPAI